MQFSYEIALGVVVRRTKTVFIHRLRQFVHVRRVVNSNDIFRVRAARRTSSVLMPNPGRVLPTVQHLGNNLIHPHTILYLGKNKRAVAADPFGIPFHYL